MEQEWQSRRGIVTDIQRFSLHDGPGIRTSVFFKGCHLRCAWCHNPETWAFQSEILLDIDKCIGCGRCAEGCYAGARQVVGVERTAAEVLEEVLQDTAYYPPDGGVTLTGGEPLLQPDFAEAICGLSRRAGLHCAIESCLAIPPETVKRLLAYCDLLMCDLKFFSEEAHRHWTGAGNALIKENLRLADSMGIPLVVRTPVVAGVNDTPEEIGLIAAYAADLRHLAYYELLPYHALGLSKRVENAQAQQIFSPPGRERLAQLAQTAGSQGIAVRIANRNVVEEQSL